MGRNFWIILAVVVLGFVGILVASGSDEDESSQASIVNPTELQADDHFKGSGEKGVTIIEYADFECPGCAAIYPNLKQLEIEFGDDVQIVFRHFPLVNIHANAMSAHRAAEAAGLQGKFWEMHDRLFEAQTQWSGRVSTQTQAIALFEQFAGELGLDVEQFKQDVQSAAAFNRIDAHMKSGTELDITGTPTLIFNGEIIDTPRTYEELRQLVEDTINGAPAEQADDIEASEEAMPLTEDADTEADPATP